MDARFINLAELLERLAQAEVAVVRRRIDVEQLTESVGRTVVLTAVVVGASEGLDDRALARLKLVGALQQDGRLGVVALLLECLRALEKAVRGLALSQL